MRFSFHPPSFFLLFLLGVLCPSYGEASSFYSTHAQGWHWYEKIPLESEDPHDKKKDPEASKPKTLRTPTDIVKAYQKELEHRLHRAWVSPTPENVKAYQEMQKDLTDRSQLFSHVWMENVYRTPPLDYTLTHPVNQKARHLELDLEKEKTRQKIQALSQSYGLFFFLSRHCGYCHGFAPIVKQFSKTYGWDVLAISMEGDSLEDFPEAVPDNGLAAQWEVQALPALFAVNPETQHVIPIAYGLISLEEIEMRILKLGSPRP